MPLLEEVATVDSAAISTAARFSKPGHGAAKSSDASEWWALMEHNQSGYPPSSYTPSTLWLLWLLALLGSTSLEGLPAPGATVALLLASAAIPDSGDTVMPFAAPLLVVPQIVFGFAKLGGSFTFLPWLLVFGIFPLLDWVIGVDLGNQTREVQKALQRDRRFQVVTLAVVPLVLFSLVYGAKLASASSPLELVGISTSVGLITGIIGIVAGHELCHKASVVERGAGRFLLSAVCHLGSNLAPAHASEEESHHT